MKNLLKQLSSFLLPVTVLILVPASVEHHAAIGSIPAFVAGLLLMLTGLSILSITVVRLSMQGKGTLAPWFPTGKLVIKGLYAHVRNPMILGVLIVLLGESLAILSRNILNWTILFFLINNAYFFILEEPGLEKRFGNEYSRYKKNVPRWIPNRKPYKP